MRRGLVALGPSERALRVEDEGEEQSMDHKADVQRRQEREAGRRSHNCPEVNTTVTKPGAMSGPPSRVNPARKRTPGSSSADALPAERRSAAATAAREIRDRSFISVPRWIRRSAEAQGLIRGGRL